MNGYFFETKYWKLALANDQRYLGRLVIKTKIVREHLPDLTQEEQADFFTLIKKLESFFREKIGATMFNYSCLMNFAYRDNETPHVHFHFRPRYKNPITILGKEFSDPNFGQPHLEPAQSGNGDVLISDKVRNFLEEGLKAYLQ